MMLQSPNDVRHYPSGHHSVGLLTFEPIITHPFHPLVGETVPVVGDHEHGGLRYILIQQSHGGSYQVPDWMFPPEVRTATIVSVARLPVSQMTLLRTLVDRL